MREQGGSFSVWLKDTQLWLGSNLTLCHDEKASGKVCPIEIKHLLALIHHTNNPPLLMSRLSVCWGEMQCVGDLWLILFSRLRLSFFYLYCGTWGNVLLLQQGEITVSYFVTCQLILSKPGGKKVNASQVKLMVPDSFLEAPTDFDIIQHYHYPFC